MGELTNLITNARDKYYNRGESIPDEDYDAILDYMARKYPGEPMLFKIGAPVVRGEKYTREIKMYSLDKAKTVDEARCFCNKFLGHAFVVSLKMDGAAVELNYKDGVLVSASTRGDGYTGELISSKAACIKNIPKVLSESVDIIVRGEVVISVENFIKLNHSNEDIFTNPRNFASGTLNRDDLNVISSRPLEFIAHGCIFEGEQSTLHAELTFLKSLGFSVVPFYVTEDFKEVEAEYNEFLEVRSIYTYQVDGLCIFLDDLKLSSSLGYTEHHPRFAVALKFPSDSVATDIIGMEWGVSRNGVITPVAILEPVECGGATISRVTLHNIDMMWHLGAKVGSTVLIKRSGDVIPYVESVIANGGKEALPVVCPSCGSSLELCMPRLLCSNVACTSRVTEGIEHFLKALDFKGLSIKSIEKLVEANHVVSIPAFFEINEDSFSTHLGFNLGAKVYHSLQSLKKSCSLTDILTGFGLPGLGKKSAALLAENFEKVTSAISREVSSDVYYMHSILMDIGFGPTQAANLAQPLLSVLRTDFLRLYNLGFNIIIPVKKSEHALKFCITGTLDRPRKDYEKLIVEGGHLFTNSLTKDVDYLIAGEGGGEKRAKAAKFGIKVITILELNDLLINWRRDEEENENG